MNSCRANRRHSRARTRRPDSVAPKHCRSPVAPQGARRLRRGSGAVRQAARAAARVTARHPAQPLYVALKPLPVTLRHVDSLTGARDMAAMPSTASRLSRLSASERVSTQGGPRGTGLELSPLDVGRRCCRSDDGATPVRHATGRYRGRSVRRRAGGSQRRRGLRRGRRRARRRVRRRRRRPPLHRPGRGIRRSVRWADRHSAPQGTGRDLCEVRTVERWRCG